MSLEGVPAWAGEQVHAVVCATVKQHPTPKHGSSIEHCHACADEVWLSASSLAVLEKYPTTPLLCAACAVKQAEAAAGWQEWPAPKTAFEVRRHLRADHDDDRWGGNWSELDALHQEAHSHDAGHGHETAS